MTAKSNVDIKKSLNELQEITEWFQEDEIDLDKGLEKLKDGVKIIKQCRKRIQEIENEFVDIKKELVETEELFDLDAVDLN